MWSVDIINKDGRMLRESVHDSKAAASNAAASLCRLSGCFVRISKSDSQETGELLTVGETAKRLGVDRQSVYGRIIRGTIKAERINGEWRILATDI